MEGHTIPLQVSVFTVIAVWHQTAAPFPDEGWVSRVFNSFSQSRPRYKVVKGSFIFLLSITTEAEYFLSCKRWHPAIQPKGFFFFLHVVAKYGPTQTGLDWQLQEAMGTNTHPEKNCIFMLQPFKSLNDIFYLLSVQHLTSLHVNSA